MLPAAAQRENPAKFSARDLGGSMTGATDSVAGTITRIADLLDRFNSETTPQGSITYNYDNADRRTSLTLANGVTVAYSVANDSRITGLTYSAGSTQPGNLTYGYDADGRVTSKNGTLAAISALAAIAGACANSGRLQTAWR
ncbi:MAG: hypothetical protein WA993_08705 [Candidatus Binatus sp.]|jgi:YD repeat-containing protein|uniref:hypothetical protein n=1 Tax=Candidatus Binatus sp. TaxID=2811406 RepID=UPI003CAFCB60